VLSRLRRVLGSGRGRALELPIPPLEMRELVGPTDPAAFDNPTGALLYPFLDDADYDAVLDFGCGCGRVARMLLQQNLRPKRYVGLDLHAGMIRWCRENLGPHDPSFEFRHHDVHNVGLNPGSSEQMLPFGVEPHAFSMVNAISVFTHLLEPAAEHYLRETANALRPGGVLVSTWFVFDKSAFPMMQDFQNALYINPDDPTNAVIYDVAWLRRTAAACGLTITGVFPPDVRGFQWSILMRPSGPGVEEAPFPEDTAPVGRRPPPLMPGDADRIGAG
jgi:SAM-dependent methyltransferase